MYKREKKEIISLKLGRNRILITTQNSYLGHLEKESRLNTILKYIYG